MKPRTPSARPSTPQKSAARQSTTRQAATRTSTNQQAAVPDPASIPCHELTLADTHRVIPTRVSPDGGTVLARLSADAATLGHLQELDDATNDRFRGEDGFHAGIALDELLFGSRFAHIVNAAFTHPGPLGGRFNSPNRGAWYASLDRPTALAEFAFRRLRHLEEIRWPEPEITLVDDYLVSVASTVHDLRPAAPRKPKVKADNVPKISSGAVSSQAPRFSASRFQSLLEPGPIPACYAPGQRLAAALLAGGAEGLLYPSVRHPGGSCLVLFRPTLLSAVRRAARLELIIEANRPFHPESARELT